MKAIPGFHPSGQAKPVQICSRQIYPQQPQKSGVKKALLFSLFKNKSLCAGAALYSGRPALQPSAQAELV